MRSGKFTTRNDDLIRRFVTDPNYRIEKTGEILTNKDRWGNGTCDWRPCIYKRPTRGRSYWYVKYKGKNICAHRIVYQKFVGELEPDLTINHIDNNSLNNRVENLELITQSENNYHAFRMGRKPSYGKTRINHQIAGMIRQLYSEGIRYSALMEATGLCKSSISYVVNGKSWIKGA